ncbi:MAG: hypothetical protein AAFO91_18700, partial [Bacteroidota bacterium]
MNGPLPSTIKLTFGDGTTVQSQENIQLDPWEYRLLYTDGNVEYILTSDNPIMGCINSQMGTSANNPLYADSRLIMPLSSDIVTFPVRGNISAQFDGTTVRWLDANGDSGDLNNGASFGPGFPVDIESATPIGTGNNNQQYPPEEATRFRAAGLVSAYSGADAGGNDATSAIPVSSFSQVVAQPLYIRDIDHNGRSSVTIVSVFPGTAEIWEWNETNDELQLAYTLNIGNTVTPTTIGDYDFPCAVGLGNNTGGPLDVELVGDLGPGIIVADEPIAAIVQNWDETFTPSIRSQNGTTSTSIVSKGDETTTFGFTPDDRAAIIRIDPLTGLPRLLNALQSGGGGG